MRQMWGWYWPEADNVKEGWQDLHGLYMPGDLHKWEIQIFLFPAQRTGSNTKAVKQWRSVCPSALYGPDVEVNPSGAKGYASKEAHDYERRTGSWFWCPLLIMSQRDLILQLLSDHKPHRTDEVVLKCYGEGMSLSRVGARIWELRKAGHKIEGWKDKVKPTLYWYRLVSSGDVSKPSIPAFGPAPRQGVLIPVNHYDWQQSIKW